MGGILKDEKLFLLWHQLGDRISIEYLTNAALNLGAEIVHPPMLAEPTTVIVNHNHASYVKGERDPRHVPYHWLAVCADDNCVVDTLELRPMLPFLVNRHNEERLGEPMRVYVSLNIERSGKVTAQEGQAAMQRDLARVGAVIVAKRSDADLIIVDKKYAFYKTIVGEKDRYNRTWQRLVEKDWVDDMLQSAKMPPLNGTAKEAEEQPDEDVGENRRDEQDVASRANSEDSFAEEDVYEKPGPGRPGKSRTAFSAEDDDFMLRYLAYHKNESRNSRKTFERMADMSHKYPIADRHSFQSWHDRFKSNKSTYGRRVDRYQNSGLDSSLRTEAEREKAKEKRLHRAAAGSKSRSKSPAHNTKSSQDRLQEIKGKRPSASRKRLVTSDDDSDEDTGAATKETAGAKDSAGSQSNGGIHEKESAATEAAATAVATTGSSISHAAAAPEVTVPTPDTTATLEPSKQALPPSGVPLNTSSPNAPTGSAVAVAESPAEASPDALAEQMNKFIERSEYDEEAPLPPFSPLATPATRTATKSNVAEVIQTQPAAGEMVGVEVSAPANPQALPEISESDTPAPVKDTQQPALQEARDSGSNEAAATIEQPSEPAQPSDKPSDTTEATIGVAAEEHSQAAEPALAEPQATEPTQATEPAHPTSPVDVATSTLAPVVDEPLPSQALATEQLSAPAESIVIEEPPAATQPPTQEQPPSSTEPSAKSPTASSLPPPEAAKEPLFFAAATPPRDHPAPAAAPSHWDTPEPTPYITSAQPQRSDPPSPQPQVPRPRVSEPLMASRMLAREILAPNSEPRKKRKRLSALTEEPISGRASPAKRNRRRDTIAAVAAIPPPLPVRPIRQSLPAPVAAPEPVQSERQRAVLMVEGRELVEAKKEEYMRETRRLTEMFGITNRQLFDVIQQLRVGNGTAYWADCEAALRKIYPL